MASQNTLEITKSGMEASITNVPNRNGFKIEISHVDIIGGGISRGHVACYGVGSSNNVVTIAAEVDTTSGYFPIEQLNFYDGISGKLFAIARAPKGQLIDMIFAGKRTFICLTMGFMILPEGTVTVSTSVDNFLERHKSDSEAHKAIFNLFVNKSELQRNPNLSYDVADSRRPLAAKYLADIYKEADAFRNKSNTPNIWWVDRNPFNGFVVKFVDGLVHQTINLKNVNTSNRGTFAQQRNSLIVDVPLLLALGNIFSVNIYLYENSGEGHDTRTLEAEEWRTSWAASASNAGRVRINLRRWSGSHSNQNINIRVVVTGME